MRNALTTSFAHTEKIWDFCKVEVSTTKGLIM